MSVSSWILERNRDVASILFGKDDATPEQLSACDVANDERKAAGLTPFILAGAGAAVFGGRVGMDRGQRVAAGAIATLLFLAI